MSELRIVGRSMLRKDAPGKVTGDTHYIADLSLENLLHGAVVRSPHHHARIRAIDDSGAREVPGVVAVISANDIPGSRLFGALLPDRQVLADGIVRHIGEPVVLVIAETRLAAEQARDLINISYEPLPVVLNPVEALAPNAPQVHAGGNLLAEYNVGHGDLDASFAAADVILEETFYVQRIYPAYLEPETCVAVWRPDETLKVWVSSQKPFEDRHAISTVLNIPEDRIEVTLAAIGGAFGGKEDSGLQVLTALAAWLVRGTVKFVNRRDESITAHPKRHAGEIHYKMGASRDGRLLAMRADLVLDTGAYASYGPAVGGIATEMATGPYSPASSRVNTKVVYTNAPFAGAMRGFGAPQAMFAVESMMDMLAAELGIDPIELRRKNVWQQGQRTPIGVLLKEPPSLNLCLDEAERARARLAQIDPLQGMVGGVGIALNAQPMGLGLGVPDECTNQIEWLPDGRVRIDVGAPDIGQGLYTVAAQIAAEALELPYDHVEVATPNTAESPNGGVPCASRMTYLMGNTMLLTARRAVDLLLDEAAYQLNKARESLSYAQGYVRLLDSGKRIAASEFTSRAAEDERPLAAQASFSFPYPPGIAPDDLPVGMPHIMFGYSAHVARVDVDPDLGTVIVRELTAIHDVGKVINQDAVEGQLEGGVAMGIGYALLEEVKLKDSGKWTDSFMEYLLPTTLDTPLITTILLETPEPGGPFGARGVGEMSMTPVAPAIANAVYNAVRRRATTLPIQRTNLIDL